MAQKLSLWLLVILWMGVIFGFSSMPINHPAPFSWTDFIIKKTAHMIEYAILYRLLFRAKANWLFCLIFGLFYSLSDEWHQTFVAGREGRLRDVGFDTIGMLLALTWLKRKS